MGKSTAPLTRTWQTIFARCNCPNAVSYPRYGGKGVKLLLTRAELFEEIGPKPGEGWTVDRYPDKTGHYERGNVRWATQKEQQNNRTNNRLIEWDGRTQTLQQWAEELGLPHNTLWNRLKNWGECERTFTPR